ncbi:hypothetical protein Tcan_17408 [Toxocara canis]|uniref:Uncharacterized protein n=1 Tax=Toxocara canis TaxID=6265 RepID=A0A0B2W2F8_TOXCA|nr:hypothetical protein Tcan_17408 [Toxocara canis]
MDSIPSLRDHRIANAYFDVEAPAHRSTDTPLYAPCDCLSDAKCDWVIISANELTLIEMSIPTGNPAIRSFVIFVTFAFIVVGTFAIILASFIGPTKRKVE